MANHSTGKFRHAFSFKGPLFYLYYMPQIFEQFQNTYKNSKIIPLKLFKKYAKSFALNIQSCGNFEEWEGQNMHYIMSRAYLGSIAKIFQKYHIKFQMTDKFQNRRCLVKKFTMFGRDFYILYSVF